mmetsp:Transcript_17952/g.20749  ORF Transcript_17952/g.20749 Transcript_17952/m.20749 type:complete len:492 (-) Transcript_17952:68-1543(-)
MSPSSASSSTKSALADATAGVAGSLVAMLAFYPIDVLKTNLQADSTRSATRLTTEDGDEARDDSHFNRTFLKSLFRGIHYKALHTVTSSFAYFFIYSYIKSRHQVYLSNKIHSSKTRTKSTTPSTTSRLLLSAISAMINSTLTLPLDVLAARSQTSSLSTSTSSVSSKGESLRQIIGGGRSGTTAETTVTISSDKYRTPNINHNTNFKRKKEQIEEKKEQFAIMDHVWYETHQSTQDMKKMNDIYVKNNNCHIDTNIKSNAKLSSSTLTLKTSNRSSSLQQQQQHQTQIYSIKSLNQNGEKEEQNIKVQNKPCKNISDWKSLWCGLKPALLLCSNPAINFTIFDMCKDRLTTSNDNSTTSDLNQISMMEAFIIGLIAKFTATIATYPLIRAKVMLMVSKNLKDQRVQKNVIEKKEKDESSSSSKTDCDNKNIDSKKHDSLMKILYDIFQKEGVPGLYKGCGLQLIHTMLKSALLMMVREKIAITTKRLIVG